MDLDKRIMAGRKPLTCLDVEQAREFAGKECIFSDNYDNFKDIDQYTSFDQYYVAILLVEDNPLHGDYVFKNAKNDIHYRLILPCEWVEKKKIEPTYRPFTGIEFAEKFDLKLGGIIRLKHIITQYKSKTIFTGYRWNGDSFEVFLNGDWMNMITLLNTYEYDEDGKWQKFGIKE